MTDIGKTVPNGITTAEGFERMYEEYFPKIYNYVFYRLLNRGDTEDIVSEVFFKAAKNRYAFNPEKASLSTWLYTIAKNTLTDFYRKRRPEISLDDKNRNVEPVVDFEEQLKQISLEGRRALYSELTKLSERERVIIYYKFFEDYTNRKIAALLNMNENTVAAVLFRTLKKLRSVKNLI